MRRLCDACAEQAEPHGWSASVSVDAFDDVPVLIPITMSRRQKEKPAERTDMSFIYRVRVVRNPAVASGVIVYITKQTYMPVATVQVSLTACAGHCFTAVVHLSFGPIGQKCIVSVT
jgi:hypothetical protein